MAPKFIRDTNIVDVAKIAIGVVGVTAAVVSAVQIKKLFDFIVGKPETIPFKPNDALYVRMKAKGKFRRSNPKEYAFWKQQIRKIYEKVYKPKIPFTSTFVANRVGGESFDWRCPEESKIHFCDQVTIKIPLEFPSFTTTKRKRALLKVAKKRTKTAFSGQFSQFEVGLQSLGGVADFEEGAEDLASLFSMN